MVQFQRVIHGLLLVLWLELVCLWPLSLDLSYGGYARIGAMEQKPNSKYQMNVLTEYKGVGNLGLPVSKKQGW